MKKWIFSFVPVLVFTAISCNTESGKKEIANNEKWMLAGDSLVVSTFDTLRNTLLRIIYAKGFTGAVNFCNVEAMNLTHTFSNESVIIKRTSDKLRNPANAPDKLEQEILAEYIQSKNDKQELKPVLKKDPEGNYHYFKPIIIQAMCLNCHGEKQTQVKPETWESIRQHYPDDSAFNYKEGDIRGIWHVIFAEK